jgi:hypothetical protein
MGHFHTLTHADAHATSFFEIVHKGSIAHALSEVFGACQLLTFRCQTKRGDVLSCKPPLFVFFPCYRLETSSACGLKRSTIPC